MAQTGYSVNPNYLSLKTEQNNLLNTFNNNYPDSSVNNLSHFGSRNFLGNVGLSLPNYILRFGSSYLGFRLYDVPLSNDQIRDRDVEYYQSLGPYAQLTGIAGTKQLQMFRMLFTQTLINRMNITLRFNRYTSLGYYNKQQSYTNNFYLSSNYSSRKEKWGYYFYVLNNNNRFQENGGIKNVQLTDSTKSLNKELLAVNTNSASRYNSETKVVINPWFRMDRRPDSLGGAQHYFQLRSSYSAHAYRFKDLNIHNDKFYRAYYYDTLTTKDSVHVMQLTNEALYTVKGSNDKFGMAVGYKNEINNVWQKNDSIFMNHFITGDLNFGSLSKTFPDSTVNSTYSNRLNFQYVVEGPMKANYRAENNSIYYFDFKKKNYVAFDLLVENRNPDYIYNNWKSNHFIWANNHYASQTTVQASASVSFAKTFSAGIVYQNIFRYLYFDEYALPRQYNKTVENLALTVAFSKVLFKHLGVLLQHTYQQTSHEAYVRIPQNASTGRLFYTGNLLRNTLQLQLGAQAQVYQSFYGYAYMPATQTFYLQNRYKTASCPFVDVYFNARIRPVSIFVKAENVLQKFLDTNYSFVAGYQQSDLALRFGITWVFFD